jgi:hypothetical protein
MREFLLFSYMPHKEDSARLQGKGHLGSTQPANP